MKHIFIRMELGVAQVRVQLGAVSHDVPDMAFVENPS